MSDAAGLTPMLSGAVLLATGLGQLPTTLICFYAGPRLTGRTQSETPGPRNVGPRFRDTTTEV